MLNIVATGDYCLSSIASGSNLIVNGDFENGNRSFNSAYQSRAC
jgi:hypothetical protein